MSEDSVKITGVTQVLMFMLIGLFYFVVLYVVVLVTQTQLINNAVINLLANSTVDSLKAHNTASAKIMLVAGVLFLSILSGMLWRDFFKKIGIISALLIFLVTIADLIPIKIFIQTGMI